MKCYICDTNEANSEEHIIPNAIGGKLKAKVLCKTCNEKLGKICEAKLAESLLQFSNWVNHSRDRGDVPDIDCEIIGENGKKIPAKRNAKTKETSSLSRKYLNKGDSFELSYVAFGKDGEDRLRKEYKQVLKSWGKKHNWSKERFNSELKRMEDSITLGTQEIQHPVIATTLSLGGKEVYLSCLKTATNFYIYKKKDKKYILDAVRILNNTSSDVLKIANLYFPDDFFPTDSIFHTIYLQGNLKNKKLICLISYYNIFQVLVLLNDNYTGDDFEECYCYDIWNEKEVSFTRLANISPKTIRWVLDNGEEYLKETRDKMVKIFDTFMKHFVINDELAKNGISTFTNFLIDIAKELASRQDIIKQDDFFEVIISEALSKQRSSELNLLKDKDIKEVILKCGNVLYEEYQRQRTYLIVSYSISKVCAQIVAREIFENEIDIKSLDWKQVKQKIIEFSKNMKINNEELNKFVDEALNYAFSNLDIAIEEMKIRWSAT